MENRKKPREIILHQTSRTLEVVYGEDERFQLPWEYLRVFSPSSEVQGRRGPDRRLVTGKQQVAVDRIAPVGNYAVKIYFDDGHNSGLYDWRYLYELATHHAEYWQDHLRRLKKAEH